MSWMPTAEAAPLRFGNRSNPKSNYPVLCLDSLGPIRPTGRFSTNSCTMSPSPFRRTKLLFFFLNPSYSINALRTGKIDGFFCAEPWNTKAVREGAGRHGAGKYPGDDEASVIVQHRGEVVPAPAHDLEVGKVGLPQLVHPFGLMPKLISRAEHDIGRTGDQVIIPQYAINTGLADEGAMAVGDFPGQFMDSSWAVPRLGTIPDTVIPRWDNPAAWPGLCSGRSRSLRCSNPVPQSGSPG